MQIFLRIIVIAVFFFITGIFISAFISYEAKEREVADDAQKLATLYPDILEGANTGSIILSAEFKEPVSTGSPLIFGGSHNPEVQHQDAWDQLEEIGVTSIRKDLFPEKAIPNTTIADYKANNNGVADVKNWNQKELQAIEDIFVNAKKRNMKTIGILAYTPRWLTHNNTGNGVPKDWEVFEDIAKKIYGVHRDNLDYIEIWNEPDWDVFLNVKGSNQKREDVYENMYYYGAKGIRSVDEEKNDGKIIPIGGPTASDTVQVSLLHSILDSDRTKEYVDFISYHNYELKEGKFYPEPSWGEYKSIASLHNVDKPFFLTEWNYTADHTKPIPNNYGISGILYSANKFISFLKMGMKGANFHSFDPVNINKPNEGEGFFGFYKWKNNKAELVPQARTWRILSSKLGLGVGESKIYEPKSDTENPEIKSVAFENSKNQYGMALVNESSKPQKYEVHFENTSFPKYARLEIYVANLENEAKKPIYKGLMKSQNGSFAFSYPIPAESVVGFVLSEEKEWFDNLPVDIDRLF